MKTEIAEVAREIFLKLKQKFGLLNWLDIRIEQRMILCEENTKIT